MAKINIIDKQLLEDAFGMQTGYVLDFSDASFKKFFENFGINIDNPKYFVNGTSKANRLRTFWEIEDNELVAETINTMADMKINKDLSILARGHIQKSAKIRERLESKIAEISRNFLVGKIKVKVASNQISAVQEDVECDMYDGKMTPQDGSAVLRACERAFDVSDMRWRVATQTFRKKGE